MVSSNKDTEAISLSELHALLSGVKKFFKRDEGEAIGM